MQAWAKVNRQEGCQGSWESTGIAELKAPEGLPSPRSPSVSRGPADRVGARKGSPAEAFRSAFGTCETVRSPSPRWEQSAESGGLEGQGDWRSPAGLESHGGFDGQAFVFSAEEAEIACPWTWKRQRRNIQSRRGAQARSHPPISLPRAAGTERCSESKMGYRGRVKQTLLNGESGHLESFYRVGRGLALIGGEGWGHKLWNMVQGSLKLCVKKRALGKRRHSLPPRLQDYESRDSWSETDRQAEGLLELDPESDPQLRKNQAVRASPKSESPLSFAVHSPG